VIDDPGTNGTCIVDTSSAVAMQEFTLEGDSPTKMFLHVRDQTFDVTTRFFNFYDYAFIKAEKNFTACTGDSCYTAMHGTLWVEILDTTPATVVYFKQDAYVDADGVNTLNFDDHTNGLFRMDNLEIPANGANHKSLVLDGPNSTLTVLDTLKVASNESSDYKAKLRVAQGTLSVQDGSAAANLILDGGPTTARSVEIDLDAALAADGTCVNAGYVRIDVASGKVLYAGEYRIGSSAHITVTGDGRVESGD
jgi:hypothetical protein